MKHLLHQIFEPLQQLLPYEEAALNAVPVIQGAREEANPNGGPAIISTRDVYHHERQVLLLKSGQTVPERALASLHRQGVPIIEACVIQEADGAQRPLDEVALNLIVNRVQKQQQERLQAYWQNIDARADVEEEQPITAISPPKGRWVNAGREEGPPPWQRHFRVLIVSHNRELHARLSLYLEQAGIVQQHIRPVMHHSAFRFVYGKYSPHCIMLDEETHRHFLTEGLNLLRHCTRRPEMLQHLVFIRSALGEEAEHFSHGGDFALHTLQRPVQRSSLMALLDEMAMPAAEAGRLKLARDER